MKSDREKKLEAIIKILKEENDSLKEEVDSLWLMIDEMTSPPDDGWSQLLDESKLDIVTRTLMISKKKVDA